MAICCFARACWQKLTNCGRKAANSRLSSRSKEKVNSSRSMCKTWPSCMGAFVNRRFQGRPTTSLMLNWCVMLVLLPYWCCCLSCLFSQEYLQVRKHERRIDLIHAGYRVMLQHGNLSKKFNRGFGSLSIRCSFSPWSVVLLCNRSHVAPEDARAAHLPVLPGVSAAAATAFHERGLRNFAGIGKC